MVPPEGWVPNRRFDRFAPVQQTRDSETTRSLHEATIVGEIITKYNLQDEAPFNFVDGMEALSRDYPSIYSETPREHSLQWLKSSAEKAKREMHARITRYADNIWLEYRNLMLLFRDERLPAVLLQQGLGYLKRDVVESLLQSPSSKTNDFSHGW